VLKVMYCAGVDAGTEALLYKHTAKACRQNGTASLNWAS